MEDWSDRAAVELFHLHFIRILAVGRDKVSYPIKGGGNLRFYFGSIRYSEDLDLDVRDVARHVLKERVESILRSQPLTETLQTIGIQVTSISAPKQTDITQRWKIQLRVSGRAVDLHTKIEFSRRSAEGEVKLDPIDPALLKRYKLMPILACHYLLRSAIRQKVGALVGRKEVQARDVFDLSVLFARAGNDLSGYADLRPQIPAAVSRVWAISYGEYKSQVVAYLVPEQADPYSSEEAWEAIQVQVVDALETIGSSG